MKIPENSNFAIKNGVQRGLILHEVDARLGKVSGDMFMAHDENARRTTSEDDRWSSLSKERMEIYLVDRQFDVVNMDFASLYQETAEKVPSLEDLIWDSVTRKDLAQSVEPVEPAESVYSVEPADGDVIQSFLGQHGCLQLDLKGNDFPRALAFFQGRNIQNYLMLLKGYNFQFPSFQSLTAAAEHEAARQRKAYRSLPSLSILEVLDARAALETFSWLPFPGLPHIIMVFDSKPIIAGVFEASGLDPKKASPKDRLNLDFMAIYRTVREQVSSFIKNSGLKIIPEIVHSGLGLGYNILTGEAVNPLDGTAIEDKEVILQSRVDRAMIEVNLKLKSWYPKLYFSSCTRLCEVRTSDREWVADMRTGKLKLKPTGEKGISSKLRGIHGGLYPQSDLVVADDPFAEIAARTWIDEYAKLDRTRLFRDPFMSYNDWIAQAGTEVVEAVNKLNGPFLPNTFDGDPDDSWSVPE